VNELQAAAYHKRGTGVCGNSLWVPIEHVAEMVLKPIGGDVLRPAVVIAVVDGVVEELTPKTVSRDPARLRSELEAVGRETRSPPRRSPPAENWRGCSTL
jgi:hypothetical protein